MSYAPKLAFYIIALNFGMVLLANINTCYQWGNTISGCPNEAGTGHPFVPLPVQLFIKDYQITDAAGNVVNTTDYSSYNQSLLNAASYKPAPSGITDIFGFFSWVVTGGRLIANTLFMPLFGFPQYVSDNFGVPGFIVGPLGIILFLVQLVGLYEFFTGRSVF